MCKKNCKCKWKFVVLLLLESINVVLKNMFLSKSVSVHIRKNIKNCVRIHDRVRKMLADARPVRGRVCVRASLPCSVHWSSVRLHVHLFEFGQVPGNTTCTRCFWQQESVEQLNGPKTTALLLSYSANFFLFLFG